MLKLFLGKLNTTRVIFRKMHDSLFPYYGGCKTENLDICFMINASHVFAAHAKMAKLSLKRESGDLFFFSLRTPK